MTRLKKALLFSGLVITTIGAGFIYHIETEYAGIGLPWTSSIKLPDLPELPAPKTTLTEDQSGDIYFSTRSPYDFSELLTNFDNTLQHTGKGELVLPKGASAENPVPAIIILHGSGGIEPNREPVYAQLFAENGIASLIIDYYSVRGATKDSTYLMKTLSASETDILVDAYSALKVLGTHPAIDASRIAVTGYSYGGMVTRYALDPRVKAIIAPEVPPFAAHIDVYGPCHQTLGTTETTGGAYLAIFGDDDNSVDINVCEQVHGDIAKNGPVETLLIPGAGHAWESDRPRDLYDFPYITNCSFSFDEKTGSALINGQPAATAPQDAGRNERAFARAMVMVDAPECIGKGYVIGSDKKADAAAKQRMLSFMDTYLKDAG
ncbi:dienelactone hydrolase family protein [uncultured Endozoicomonas sp.]|uniref:dienelactone hydrolase family protein n=1 Tax=uncultured Endozoicomonas sp. TaxID=432652 RepID=UPI0026031FA0|nr:dienelactone hydrolase family protein [uncultured Endozoicomonas sp.]